MSTEILEQSKQPGGAHHLLAQLVGTWQGMARTWFKPGELADESPIRGTIEPVFDGNFVEHRYEGGISGKPMHGRVIYGYNIGTKKFESSWINTFHMGTGIMFSEGEALDNGFSVLGSFDAGEGLRWGWRTTIEVIDAHHIVITAYITTPDGEEGKATEIEYSRAG